VFAGIAVGLLLKGFEFTDCTVKEKKQYQYRILAENEGGISDPSAESALVKAKPFKGYLFYYFRFSLSGYFSGVSPC